VPSYSSSSSSSSDSSSGSSDGTSKVSSPPSKHLKAGAIAGIAVGGFVFLILLGAIVLACLRGRWGNEENAQHKKGVMHRESTIDQKDSGTSHQGSAIFDKGLTHLHQKSTTDPRPACVKIPTLPYAYEPIDGRAREIRLLTIFGGKFGSRIICSLSPVKLDTSPSYEALSYVWELNPPPLPKAGEMPPEPPMFPLHL
jgi:hypothetical protein